MHPHYLSLLLGTAGSWFILDVTFYGNSNWLTLPQTFIPSQCFAVRASIRSPVGVGLFSGDVTQAIGAAESPKDEAVTNFYINMLAMPGYIHSLIWLHGTDPVVAAIS